MLEDDCDVSNINADTSHIQNSDIVRNCVSDLAINVSVNDSHVDLSYRHSFCAESDASRRANLSLRRGKPNSIKAGLLQGEQKRVSKLRRSFGLDKSDISDPIPVMVPPLPQCLDAKSVGNEQKADMKDNSVKLRSDISISKINGNLSEVDNSEDKNSSAVDNTQNVAKSEDGTEKSKQTSETAYDSDVSEARSSTISGDTVKIDPINSNSPVSESTSGEESSKPTDIVQNQTNDDSNKKYPKMQTVDSTDSLLSGQLETSPSSKSMSRSISTDSGKGSMFDESGVVDNCEPGKQQSTGNIGTEEDEMETEASILEDNANETKMKKCNSVHSVKDSLTANVSRSHSMYCNTSLIKKQPNLQISAETHKLLSRAGYLSNKNAQAASDDDFVVMGPGILKIKQAETIKPRRESIIQLQTAHKGRVKHSIKQFNQGINKQDTEVTERHMSPYRFANSVSRKVGNASLKVPDILNNTPCEVSEMHEVININRLGKGQAKVPISTHLLKPTEDETVDSDKNEKGTGVGRKISLNRRPSIYYASSEGSKNKVLNKTQVKMLDVTLANVQEESVIIEEEPCAEKSSIDQEPMDVTETTDKDAQQIQDTNKENGQCSNTEVVNTEKMEKEKDDEHQVAFDKVELNESLIDTINSVCTPKLDKIAKYVDEKFVKSPLRETNTSFQESTQTPPKLPPRVPIIKQPILTTPLTDRVCLRTAGGMTPRQVIKNCNSPRSPMKPVKRLKSPGSPHRGSRLHSSPGHKKSTQLSSIPQHLQQEMEGI